MTSRVFVFGLAIVGVALSPVAARTTAAAETGNVTRALRHDLKAIPPGSHPTKAQKQALATDLGGLFDTVLSPPSVTLDYLAGQLAKAASQSRLEAGDYRAIALALTEVLDGSAKVNAGEVAALKTLLAQAGADPSIVKQVGVALKALPVAFAADTFLNYTQTVLQGTGPGYAGVTASANFQTTEGPISADIVVPDPYTHLVRSLGVTVGEISAGTYHVSVTTAAGGQPTEIGTFVIDANSFPPSDDPLNPPFVVVGFGDVGPSKPLPAGVTLEGTTGVVITDDQGVQRFAGSFTDPAAITTRERRLHLVAGGAAPVAHGNLVATSFRGGSNPSQSFEFVSAGLPANATLTLTINGTPAQTVQTGPTGDLYVKTKGALFIKNPPPSDPANLLPTAVDLSAAQSFGVSDAQGVTLLSATAQQ